MDDVAVMRDALNQNVDDDFAEVIQQTAHKYLADHAGNAIPTHEVERMIFKEVVSSEAFNRLQNSLCIDLSRPSSKLGRRSELGLHTGLDLDLAGASHLYAVHENDRCTCRLRLDFLLHTGNSFESNQADLINVILQSLLCASLTCKLQMIDFLTNLVSQEQISLSSVKKIENGLHSCLLHSSSVIHEATMTMFTSALCSTLPNLVKESYISLLRAATKISGSEDLLQLQLGPNLKCLYNIMSVINNFQQNVSKHWLRYPEDIITSLIEETFEIFNSSWLTGCRPLALLYGLVDPYARWLRNWLYCRLSRSVVFNTLQRNKQIISELLEMCHNFLTERVRNSTETLEVSHAASFLIHFAFYEEGIKLVMEANGSNFDLWSMLLDVAVALEMEEIAGCFVKFSQTYLINSASSNEFNEEIFKQIIFAIENHNDEPPEKLRIVSKCLERISLTFQGKLLLLENAMLFQAIKNFMESDGALKLFSSTAVINFLHMLQSLLRHPKGIKLVLQTEFLDVILDCFYDLISKNVGDFLFTVLSCPLGLNYCYQRRNDAKICQMLDENFSSLKVKCKFCKYGDARVLYQVQKFQILKTGSYDLIPYLSDVLQSEKCCICHGHGSHACVTNIGMIVRSLTPLIETCISHVENFDFKEVLSVLKKNIACADCADRMSLMILSSCVSNLRTFFYLTTKFDIQEFLLEKQMAESCDGEIRVSENTVFANNILLRMLVFGGPGERIVPPKMLVKDEYNYPFITSKCIPTEFCVTISQCTSSIEDNISSRVQNVNDLNSFKELFFESISPEHYKSFDLKTLVDIFINVTMKDSESEQLTTPRKCQFTEAINVGIKKAVEYGISCKMLSSDISIDDHMDNVKELFHLVHSLHLFERENHSFDFLVATLYIISSGKKELAEQLLALSFKNPFGLISFGDLFYSLTSNIPSYQNGMLCTHFDVLVYEVLPRVSSALARCGITPSDLWIHWMAQMFWNYLDIRDIAYLIMLCIVCGAEYAMYFSVSVLKFWEQKILQCVNSYDLYTFLTEQSLEGFSLNDHVHFMNSLQQKYKVMYEATIFGCLNK